MSRANVITEQMNALIGKMVDGTYTGHDNDIYHNLAAEKSSIMTREPLAHKPDPFARIQKRLGL